MKIYNPKYKILTFVFTVLLSKQSLFAENKPPAPKGSGGFDDSYVVGGAIDDFLPYFMVIAIAFGLWSIYNKFYKFESKVK